MKNEFTVEESNLISIYTEEGEMMELSLRVIVKLIDLTDQEFAELEFIVAE